MTVRYFVYFDQSIQISNSKFYKWRRSFNQANQLSWAHRKSHNTTNSYSESSRILWEIMPNSVKPKKSPARATVGIRKNIVPFFVVRTKVTESCVDWIHLFIGVFDFISCTASRTQNGLQLSPQRVPEMDPNSRKRVKDWLEKLVDQHIHGPPAKRIKL